MVLKNVAVLSNHNRLACTTPCFLVRVLVASSSPHGLDPRNSVCHAPYRISLLKLDKGSVKSTSLVGHEGKLKHRHVVL